VRFPYCFLFRYDYFLEDIRTPNDKRKCGQAYPTQVSDNKLERDADQSHQAELPKDDHPNDRTDQDSKDTLDDRPEGDPSKILDVLWIIVQLGVNEFGSLRLN